MVEIEKEKEEVPTKPKATRLLKGFIIGISYSASIGGCGSLVGIFINWNENLILFVKKRLT